MYVGVTEEEKRKGAKRADSQRMIHGPRRSIPFDEAFAFIFLKSNRAGVTLIENARHPPPQPHLGPQAPASKSSSVGRRPSLKVWVIYWFTVS